MFQICYSFNKLHRLIYSACYSFLLKKRLLLSVYYSSEPFDEIKKREKMKKTLTRSQSPVDFSRYVANVRHHLQESYNTVCITITRE